MLLIFNYKATKYSCDYQLFQELFGDFLIPNSRIFSGNGKREG